MSDEDATVPPPQTEPVDPFVGVILDGRYRIEKVVGVGGFGRVYRARQLNIDRAVAVKVLSFDASQKADQVRRFQNEASIISKLRHPNTLKLVDSGSTPDGRLYIATEFLSGAPLDVVLRARPMDTVRALRLLRQMCGSLAEAHENGVVHRDLKPANIFIEPVAGEEVLKVLDFGVAKLTQQATETASGTIFGTPAYMSPEQAKGEEVDGRSDLYSMGVLAYEMLTGRPPFRGSTPMSLLLKHIQEVPAPPSSLVTEPLSPAVEAFVMRLLAKAPAQRPQSASEVGEVIDALLMQLSGSGLAVSGVQRRSEVRATPTIEASNDQGLALALDSVAGDDAEDDIPAYYATGRRPWMVALLALSGIGGLAAWALLPGETAPPKDPDTGVSAIGAAPSLDATVPADVTIPDVPIPDVAVDVPQPDVKKPPVCRWVTKSTKVYDKQLHIWRTKKKRVRVCR